MMMSVLEIKMDIDKSVTRAENFSTEGKKTLLSLCVNELIAKQITKIRHYFDRCKEIFLLVIKYL